MLSILQLRRVVVVTLVALQACVLNPHGEDPSVNSSAPAKSNDQVPPVTFEPPPSFIADNDTGESVGEPEEKAGGNGDATDAGSQDAPPTDASSRDANAKNQADGGSAVRAEPSSEREGSAK